MRCGILSGHQVKPTSGDETFVHRNSVRDLYTRLKRVGYDSKFIKDHVLPDWWDDSLADVPANRALAEAMIAAMLKLSVVDLRDPARALALPPVNGCRLKKSTATPADALHPSVLVADQVANSVAPQLVGLRDFQPCSAKSLRGEILDKGLRVNLESLLESAWGHGVAVIHLGHLPKASKRFSGMALCVRDTHMVVLASNNDRPPWLAFHLAHELGHLFLGHVDKGSRFAHGELEGASNDKEEREANEFAIELLCGTKQLGFQPTYGLKARGLWRAAATYGNAQNIDPGSVALVYGFTANRMAVAQTALKLMGQDTGARKAIWDALAPHLDLSTNISEVTERHLRLLSSV